MAKSLFSDITDKQICKKGNILASKIIGCVSYGNGGDGIHLGRGSNTEVINCETRDNERHGISYHRDSDVSISGHISSGNKLEGIYEIDSNLLESIGLPGNIDIEKFNELIKTLQQSAPDEKEKIIYSSFLSGTLAILADSTTIVMNILDFANQMPPLF